MPEVRLRLCPAFSSKGLDRTSGCLTRLIPIPLLGLQLPVLFAPGSGDFPPRPDEAAIGARKSDEAELARDRVLWLRRPASLGLSILHHAQSALVASAIGNLGTIPGDNSPYQQRSRAILPWRGIGHWPPESETQNDMRQYRKAEIGDVASVSGCYRGFIRRPMKRTTPVCVSRIRKMNG